MGFHRVKILHQILHRSLLFTLVLALPACADFPLLDAAVSDRARIADFPRILPLDALIASVPPHQGGLGVGDLPTRIQALQARATTMRAHPVIDAATRARMQAALARHR